MAFILYKLDVIETRASGWDVAEFRMIRCDENEAHYFSFIAIDPDIFREALD